MIRARHKLLFPGLLGSARGYLLNENFLLASQYAPGGWLYDSHSRATTATRVNSSGVIESVAIDVPRLQHDKDGNPLGYLHEPQATNHFEEFTLASPSLSLRVTNTESVDDSPVVGQKWRDLILTTDTGAHRIGEDFNVTTGGEYTASFCVKDAGARYVSIPIYPVSGGFAGAVFDLQVGTVTQELGGATGDIEATSDGYRISATATTDGGLPNQAGLCICNSGTPGTTTPSFTGDGTSGIKFTGGQVEEGSTPTSLIPTNGAAATRQQDLVAVVSTSPKADDITFYLEVDTESISSPGPVGIITDLYPDGYTGQDYIDFDYLKSSDALRAVVRSANATRCAAQFPVTGGLMKAAVCVSGGTIFYSVDGAGGTVSLGSSFVADLDRVSIGARGNNSAPVNAVIGKIQVIPRAISLAALHALTSA